ncbi:MAG: type II toxin-antitoxin system HicA family toxin [Chthoniobacter sp.]|uniref:type II toxin-antitoxin system HicA family toxin n=1 Tax=Chthoniobacter sp. TaxID=2510640 RepID=UPI0032A2F065
MKIPRDWSGADMVRALKKLGFLQDRQVGSHVRMVKGAHRATVPMHTPIPTGTFQSILKQAGITLEELLNA